MSAPIAFGVRKSIGVPSTLRMMPLGTSAGVISKTSSDGTVSSVSWIGLPRSPDRLKNVCPVKLTTVFRSTATASYSVTSSSASVTR